MTETLLKLKAKDAEDVGVISAILQDAIVPVCDIAWQPTEKNFILTPQRLRREAASEAGLSRICCALSVKGVEAVQATGIDLTRRELMFDLLAVVLEDGNLTFICAGSAKIRLRLGQWFMTLEDFGEAWPVQCNPCHEEGSAS